MPRTNSQELEALALEDLSAALADLGVSVDRKPRSGNLAANVDGKTIPLDVHAVSDATPDRVAGMVGRRRKARPTPLLVADRIPRAARQRLQEAGWGWLDRRGHLALRAPGVIIDRELDPKRRATSAAVQPIAGLAGRAVAYALLTEPDVPMRVRPNAPRLGISPASISTGLRRLRESGLVEPDGTPVLPELFWALADVWQPDRTWLAHAPKPSDVAARTRDLTAPGWALTGTTAAAAWGAPIAATATTADLYVPGPVEASIAARRFGSTEDPSRAKASLAVAPVSLVTSRRFPSLGRSAWPLVHPLAVALDLAQDVSRGREILEEWTPPAEFTRVWR